jgi:hypothetical protein
LSHSIALEAATKIRIHEISFSIVDCMQVDLPDYEAPMPVLVRRADGGVVTIGDIDEQLSRYLFAHKDEILEAKSPFLHMTHEITAESEHVVEMPIYEDVLALPETPKLPLVGSLEA